MHTGLECRAGTWALGVRSGCIDKWGGGFMHEVYSTHEGMRCMNVSMGQGLEPFKYAV